MPHPYTPPGVTIEEQVSQSITPVLAVPGTVCLVGLANGQPQQTETLTLTGTSPVAFTQVPDGANVSIVSVLDHDNPQYTRVAGAYGSPFDYTVNLAASPPTLTRIATQTGTTVGTITAGTDVSFTLASTPLPVVGQSVRITHTTQYFDVLLVTAVNSGTKVVTISSTTPFTHNYATGAAVSWGIPLTNSVANVDVTYEYGPADYFYPIRYNSMQDIQARFGPAVDTTNSAIVSKLSFAAQCAFANGASSIVLQPFYILSSGARVDASDFDTAQVGNWETVLNGLLGLTDIDTIVPVVGQSDSTDHTDESQAQIFSAVATWLYTMQTQNDEGVMALLGEDSTTSSTGTPLAQDATLQTHAQDLLTLHGGLVAQDTVLLNTTSFSVAGSQGVSFNVGGQYAAAAVAGMLVSRSPSAPLTRQPISGFVSVNDQSSKAQKDVDASYGLCVVENKGTVVQIRHGITLDFSTAATREINIVRTKHYLINTVRETLDDQIIGKVVADANATTTVNNVVIGALEDLRLLNYISNYDNVESRITSIDPTMMEVRFSYQPLFYVNYITVIFTVDLTQQNITLSSQGVTG